MTPDILPIELRRRRDWRAPLAVAAGLAHRDGALCLLSDGAHAGEQRSFIAAEPDWTHAADRIDGSLFADLDQPALARGVVGLAAYDAGARAATGERPSVWPDLILARYPALLVFDPASASVEAVGRGRSRAEAETALSRAEAWLDQTASPVVPAPPSHSPQVETPPDAYRRAVAEVTERIAAGELFQANIARGWTGRLKAGADPFDVFLRLAEGGGAPFAAFWRLGERALVSNSPELFLTLDPGGRIETRPIKGTRPRRADPAEDAAEAEALLASAKDRAENLMIVDLMRNDLARVARPGSVTVERLFELERLPTVHHLVSTVVGRLKAGLGAADVLTAAFPPGSITGAPKHQAMKVIADLEPPRGPWCGSLFLLDPDGRLSASVLIRTAAFTRDDEGWAWRAQAGAGIVADSDPDAELQETEAKFSALRRALAG
ncbi:anthranilate synthase component I family protein [Brevundimonas sp. VNH65]|uniref:anthranilate synthase component I family protein n=1 Tax=Brevundimonas sp. VNH65 TaxID=3400917 RepID=UPI003C07F95C